MIKDYRSVPVADIIALAVERRRVVHHEEDFQDFTVGNNGRVKGDLHDFGMPRIALVYAMCRGIIYCSAAVARFNFFDATNPLVYRF